MFVYLLPSSSIVLLIFTSIFLLPFAFIYRFLTFPPIIFLGTGLVIARLADNTWSAPSAICTFGLSWGFVAGLDVTDYVIILNTPEAVQAFSGSGQLTIGAGIEVAVGPVGRCVK